MRFKLTLLSAVGNMIGAVLAFLYFSYINVGTSNSIDNDLGLHYIIYFIIGTGIIFLVVLLAVHRWTRDLYRFEKEETIASDLDAYSAQQLRRKALHMVPVTTAASLFGWLMAGFIFGMFMPIIMTMFFGFPETSLIESARTFFGIFCIGGSITALFIYFSAENIWRKSLPQFFSRRRFKPGAGGFSFACQDPPGGGLFDGQPDPPHGARRLRLHQGQHPSHRRPGNGKPDHIHFADPNHLYHHHRYFGSLSLIPDRFEKRF